MSEQRPGAVETPWTPEQVESLNAYQHAGMMHPFTCGDDACRAVTGGAALLATPSGWVCTRCTYRQFWAHAWMADWSWRGPAANPVLDALKEVSYLIRGEVPEPGHAMARLEVLTNGGSTGLSMPDIRVTYLPGGRIRAEAEDAGRTWAGESDSTAGAVIALLANRAGYKAVVTFKDEAG